MTPEWIGSARDRRFGTAAARDAAEPVGIAAG